MREARRARRKRPRRRLACKLHDLGHGVLEEARGHARGAHASDLLLVHQDAHARPIKGRVGQGQLRLQRRVGTYPVVLPVADDHADRSKPSSRARPAGTTSSSADRKSSSTDAVLLRQQLHARKPSRAPSGELPPRSATDRVAARASTLTTRDGCHQQVQVLAFHHFAGLLAHLVVGQVYEQVGHAENRVVRAHRPPARPPRSRRSWPPRRGCASGSVTHW